MTTDELYVQWEIGNRRHPRNWDVSRKVYDISLIFFLEFFTYLLGQALGGILFPPYSEAFGRKKLYIISTALYSISCLVVAAVPSLSGATVGRFVSGFLSAIPTTVVIGSIEDMFNARDRVWMLQIWTGLLTFLLLTIRESRPSLLLAREVAQLRKASKVESLEGVNPDHTPDLHSFVRLALSRPVLLFFTEPIVFIVSMISAISIALVYLFTEALPPIYESFGFSPRQASLPFVAIGVGLSLGLLTRFFDLYIIDQHRQQGRVLLPEHKLLGLWLGTPILAGGLWVFAWTIPPGVKDLHWSVSVIALLLVGYSLTELDYVLGGYLTDSYLSYASSGFSALSFLRSILSAVFPLVSPHLFSALGANLAVTVLAAMATIFCIVPPLFTRYGEKLRARSAFAKQSLTTYRQYSVDENGY
ncbi:hypothetical protein ACP6JC_000393 [Aspergillus fumigatus]